MRMGVHIAVATSSSRSAEMWVRTKRFIGGNARRRKDFAARRSLRSRRNEWNVSTSVYGTAERAGYFICCSQIAGSTPPVALKRIAHELGFFSFLRDIQRGL